MFDADATPDLPDLIVPVWPVLVTLLPPSLLEVSQHHDHGDSPLDDHLPEVLERDRLRGNGGDELLLDIYELDWGGIDIGDGWVSCKYACVRFLILFGYLPSFS